MPRDPVCRYYQQATCKFGNDCRFLHINPDLPKQPADRRLLPADDKYNISADGILRDLTVDLPPWILSAYGPGSNAPVQLLGGPLHEQSWEEMRLRYQQVTLQTGNELQARQEFDRWQANAQKQMQEILADLNGAVRFIHDGVNRHPNREDICRQAGGASAAVSSTFGQPSNLGPSTFAAPAFGQPSQPQSVVNKPTPSGFGQSSHPQAAFGQPSHPQAVFGQPSQPLATPTFGQQLQPQAQFGQPSQPQAQFGQPSPSGQPSQSTSVFGQPSSVGARPNPFSTPSFGKPSQPNISSTFGQPSPLGTKPDPFSTPSDVLPNPFSNRNAAPAAASNTFAQSAAVANPFAAAAKQATPNGPASFAPASGNGPARPSGLGSFQNQVHQPYLEVSAPVPFGHPSQSTRVFAAVPTTAAANSESASSSGPYPLGSTRQHPPIESYSKRRPDGSLATWKGKPVVYKNGQPGLQAYAGAWTRIWFPDGPPPCYRDTQLSDEAYGVSDRTQWGHFLKTGRFDGQMPGLPPKREFCTWDL